MTSFLTGKLPAPKQVEIADSASESEDEFAQVQRPAAKSRNLPRYGNRKGFVPRSLEDYGDGGAYPEIHVAQYPLDLGRKNKPQGAKTLPVQLDAEGNVQYGALVRQGQGEAKVVFSQHKDLVPKEVTSDDLVKPSMDEEMENIDRTRAALEKITNAKISSSNPCRVDEQALKKDDGPTYIRYTPGQQGGQFNSGAQQRIIRVMEVQKDPMEPPKFKGKKVPRGPGSPPVPVMHSPPRKLTVKDQQDWKIPPCISNWKNSKGYTIPLDKRLAADGRSLQESTINDNFAKLSEALYIAEDTARNEINKRAAVTKKIAMKEKERKEEELRQLAQQARLSRAMGRPVSADDDGMNQGGAADSDGEDAVRSRPPIDETREEREERIEREKIREERRRERERERRQEALHQKGGKSKVTRDHERDISEKIALGLANAGNTQETMYDQRLFNQSMGLDQGFGGEDAYNVYDKPLFAEKDSSNAMYRPKKDVEAAEESVDDLMKTARFKPNKGFDGTDQDASRGPRNAPVEFETEVEEDPFGLDKFLSSDKKGESDRPSKRSRRD